MALAMTATGAAAQQVQGTGLTTLRVTVLDETDAALIIAQVTLVNTAGVERHGAGQRRGHRAVRQPRARQLPGAGVGRELQGDGPARHREARRQRGHDPPVGGHHRADRRRPGRKRGRPPRQRLHADAHAGRDRRALRRPGRDGRSARADGRARRAGLRRRLPRRPPAPEGSDPADPLQHQLVLGRVPRGRHGARRGHHAPRHGRVARPRQLRLQRRVAERDQRVCAEQGTAAGPPLQHELPGPAREGQDRHLDVGGRQRQLRLEDHRRQAADR